MAYPRSSSNVVLPSIRTVFPDTKFQSCLSPNDDDNASSMPLKHGQPPHDLRTNNPPYPAYPHNVPAINYGRRVSTTSTTSTVPPLSYSPSPSLSPSPPYPRNGDTPPRRIRLVPCSLQTAHVAVAEPRHPKTSPSASFNDQPKAVLLVGSAITRAIKEERKVHPYRIARD